MWPPSQSGQQDIFGGLSKHSGANRRTMRLLVLVLFALARADCFFAASHIRPVLYLRPNVTQRGHI
jgi:hypothetical protein